MSHALSRIVDGFRGLDVLVIGEAMLDSYLEGTTDRLCREAPVPIVALSGARHAPGGAANAAVNAAALGARVRFLSVVGDDAEARTLRQALARHKVKTDDDLLIDPARRTLSKTRVVASGQLLLRFDAGSTGPVTGEVERELIGRLRALFRASDVVIVSDYGYGILTPAVIQSLAGLQGRTPRVRRRRLEAPRGLSRRRPDGGQAELRGGRQARRGPVRRGRPGRLAGRADHRVGRLLPRRHRRADGRGDARHRRRRRPRARPAAVSDVREADASLPRRRRRGHVPDDAGPGPGRGRETPAAADLASAASAVVVSHEGTAACTAADLRGGLDCEGKAAADRDELIRRVEDHRKAGRRIVFTNGCFDILHRGHTSYLSRAKALGDVLVVGVNSDASIRRLKGPARPINAEEDRVGVLAALSCVDHLIVFDEDTPCDLVRAVRPDVFVKGGDYTRDRLPEAAIVDSYGGEVRILPYVADRSTTDIIAKIRAVQGEDGRAVAVPVARGARA